MKTLFPVCAASCLVWWRLKRQLSSSADVQEFPSAALDLVPPRKKDLAELERLLICFARIIVCQRKQNEPQAQKCLIRFKHKKKN